MASPQNKLSSPFTLYYGTYSMCSTLVRTTFALRGPPRPDGRPEMTLQPRAIDISPVKTEQLTEFYLTTINPNGLVPALANDALFSEPMLESAAISWYIADWYPQLLPAEHESEIRGLVSELHQINAGILTMGPGGKLSELLLAKTRELLGQEGLSKEYRQLLEAKQKVLEKRVENGTQETLEKHIALTEEFLSKVQSLREKNGTNTKDVYIFGANPSVLDTHTLVFLCRLVDVRRSELIPPALLEWVEHFRQGAAWKEVMEVVPGGTTLPTYL